MKRQGRGSLFGFGRRESGPVAPLTALNGAKTALYAWSLASDRLDWSPNAAAVLGLPEIGLVADGAGFAAAIEPQGGAGRAEAILAADDQDRGDGVPYRARYALRVRGDRLVMVEDSGRWFADAAGRPAFARGTVRADLDPAADAALAGAIRARAAFLAEIAPDVAEARRSRHAMTLVVGTLSGEDGEAALLERLKPLLRRRDRLVAYAPDRFALVLATCPPEEAGAAMERLLRLAAPEAGAEGLRLGAASAPEHAADAPGLLRRAEEALAGAAGPFALYAPAPKPLPANPPGTDAFDVVTALNTRGLMAAHRPVLDAHSRAPVFATLVPRLAASGHGARAGDLAPALAEAGLPALLDTRLLELAADHLAVHTRDRLCVPVSLPSLADTEWLNALAAHLGARPGIASRLIVEVPEAALAGGAVRAPLNAMKALGVGVMIGGFGGGHADFAQLKALPVDLLRIDGALIGNLARSTDDRLLVHRLVDLAHHLNLGTVAEWVEDDATARLLASWGVDYVEGPLCGEAAVPARESVLRKAAG